MALISKGDLYYNDYSWTAYGSDNPKVSGPPDDTLLSRKEGYEMLYFINKYAEIHGLKEKHSATKVERMIREELPGDIRSQKNIKTWLDSNWRTSKF